MSSVSLDPPLVIWSLALRSRSLDAFEAAKYYAVNMLAHDQLDPIPGGTEDHGDLPLERAGDADVLESADRRQALRTLHRPHEPFDIDPGGAAWTPQLGAITTGINNAAVQNPTVALANELAKDGILVNAIVPTAVRTDRHDKNIREHVAERMARVNDARKKKMARKVADMFRARYGAGDVRKYYSKLDAAVRISLG